VILPIWGWNVDRLRELRVRNYIGWIFLVSLISAQPSHAMEERALRDLCEWFTDSEQSMPQLYSKAVRDILMKNGFGNASVERWQAFAPRAESGIRPLLVEMASRSSGILKEQLLELVGFYSRVLAGQDRDVLWTLERDIISAVREFQHYLVKGDDIFVRYGELLDRAVSAGLTPQDLFSMSLADDPSHIASFGYTRNLFRLPSSSLVGESWSAVQRELSLIEEALTISLPADSRRRVAAQMANALRDKRLRLYQEQTQIP
jgi:hypothetical protein